MANDVEHLFMCILSLGKCLLRLGLLFIWFIFIFIFLLTCMSYLDILNKISYQRIAIFPPNSVDCVFTFFMVRLSTQMFLILMKPNLHSFKKFVISAFGVISKKTSKISSYVFFLRVFIVSTFTFRFMIHFELIFVWYKERVQLHSFACGYPFVLWGIYM